MSGDRSRGMARRDFLTSAALASGIGVVAPWANPLIGNANAVGPAQESGFDPKFALEVTLPLALAAYAVADCNTVPLPPGFVQTAVIKVDVGAGSTTAERHPEVTALAFNALIFGMMGRSAATRTAFVAFRGTVTFDDVITDIGVLPEPYAELNKFGCVHSGFQTVYRLVRPSIVNHLAVACEGCDRLLVIGHSLGAALAVLAAPDIFLNMQPNIQPSLTTFAGPTAGLGDFAKAFNNMIKSCFRVVNFLDLVPYVPPWPYVHVGSPICVDSGGSIDPLWRHSLYAYQAGLEKLNKSTV
ncbi:hypothetical protein MSIMFB_04987 [Mycobacterium simulans]|uniref:Fungal lipase-type domain-containing protein n=1 Tax=Mycobacterium simulans TaxID=627089 RepID=A0A7Z7IPL7_9MYCO|nr:lipase family protein [Mycobacterium simulans]SOJ57509.1 hypothetical protein MSIMFB_04987 [Mycobacterium simulans]